jgi:hypothetical protein
VSKVRLFKVASFYPEYLDRLYKLDPGLSDKPYVQQYEKMMEQGIGWADYWKINLEKTGQFLVELVIINNEFAQKKWAHENNVSYNNQNWLEEIFLAQVSAFDPEIFFANDYVYVNAALRKKVKKQCPTIKKVIGWDGIGMCDAKRFEGCDLMLSGGEHFLKYYAANGFKTHLFQFAFEQTILSKIDTAFKKYDISFVGSLTLRNNGHHNRLRVLGEVARKHKVDYWLASFDDNKPYLIKNILLKLKQGKWQDVQDIFHLWRINKGNLFGLEMYQALAYSNITLNSHIDTALNYGGNIRLWEATGVGACLVTDWKQNMDSLFVPDEEVVVYKTPQECADKVQYLLNNPDKMHAIALAGQRRTLNDYTYEKRLADMIPVLLM